MPTPPPPPPMRYKSRRQVLVHSEGGDPDAPPSERPKSAHSRHSSTAPLQGSTSSAAPPLPPSTLLPEQQHLDSPGIHVSSDAGSRSSAMAVSTTMSNTETLRATVSALRAENAVLRQRIAVLTTSFSESEAEGQGGTAAAPPTHVVGLVPPSPARSPDAQVAAPSLAVAGGGADAGERELLRARVRRLEAALQLEAAERDALEVRVLAQERVLQDLQLRLLKEG